MKLSEKFRIKPGSKVHLSQWDPDDTGGFKGKKHAKAAMEKNLQRLAELQYVLYAENRRSFLVVLQAMDSGGKDGTIRHVMSGMNPQGCRVCSFKKPTEEELSHDFLWRVHKVAPRTGEVVVFNRSHYEEVLVVRVHNLVPPGVWRERYEQINEFEKTLTAAGVHVLKFFLHISKDEQLKRLTERVEDPAKQWKFNGEDLKERQLWDPYVQAYEQAVGRCSTEQAPWFVIPANHNWFRNLAVSQILAEAMEAQHMKLPPPAFDLATVKLE